MGFLDRSAFRRAERQLASHLEGGEEIVEVDRGRTPEGERVDYVATTSAVCLVAAGEVIRIPYTTIRSIQGGSSWLALTTLAGTEYAVDFGRAGQGITDVVVERYKAVARKRRRFHVRWGSGGASFLAIPGPEGGQVSSWTLDEDTVDDVSNSMLIEQALGELEVALGLDPSLQHEHPRPSWMGDFEWTPPLPGSLGNRA